MLKPSYRIPALILCGALLSACGGAPTKNAKLESAQAVYSQAQVSPEIAATPSAQVYLQRAAEALNQARSAKDVADVEHFAHVAEQQAKIALEMGKRKAAEQEVETLGKERGNVVLEAREKEIDRARAEAEARAREAEARGREAELAMEKARQAEAQARELERQLNELQAKKTERGMVLTLGDVLFETGKSVLLPGAMGTVTRLAAFLKEHPEKSLLIEGHTDSRGSDSYNLDLSRNRAASVYSALIAQGISSERMKTHGYGKSNPIADNNSETGRQQNRRVEIIIQD
jgi:OmpA-OmpF porin, OOP family